MDRAAQLRLALDVDHPGLAGVRTGGDAGRAAEGVIAERDDRDAVDLPHGLPVGADQERAFGDLPPEAVLDQVCPVSSLADGFTHVVGPDDGMPVPSGPEHRLAHVVPQIAEPGGQSLPVRDQAGAVLDEPRHGVRAEGRQPLFPADTGDEAGVEELEVRRPWQGVLEIDLDLEQLAEVLVQGVEQVIEPGSADEDDLHGERDRLGGQPGGG